MGVPEAIFAALEPLVAGRCYPLAFPQSRTPIWPAIRYTLVAMTPGAALCGDGGEESAEHRVQLDLVTLTYDDMRALGTAVFAVMRAIEPPAILQTYAEEVDPETGTFRSIVDYLLYPSSITV